MISAERIRRAVRVGVLACVGATLWLAAAPAFAGPVYTPGGYVGSEGGHEGGEFGEGGPNGVAVEGSSADVYVVDGGNSRVQEAGRK